MKNGLDDHFRDFDRKTRRVGIAGVLVVLAVNVGVLVFIGWVVVKLMAHFGVI